jgi:ArsR family transcriptional regulator
MKPKEAVEALSSLAQETRLAIYRLLVEAGPNGLAAGLIANKLGVLPSSLSFHLAQLTRSGLVTQRRASRSLIYAAEYGQMNELMTYLTENCCGGQACAPVCQPARTAARGKRRKSA